MKIVTIYVLFSFLSPFLRDVLDRKCSLKLPGNAKREFDILPVLLVPFSQHLQQPFVSFEWIGAKGGGWGGV